MDTALLDLTAAAREAWIYGLPLIEVANVRYNVTTGQSARGQAAAINRLVHNRRLATAKSRAVTSPNVDTVYSSGFFDLSAAPATITLPPAGERYVSLQLMDAFTNTFCILGTRTTGPNGGRFTLAGPTTDAAPAGAIRAPTPWVWALARTLVDGEADYAAANAVQEGISITADPGRQPAHYAHRESTWQEYFDSLQRLLIENPPPVTDLAFFHRVQALGLGPNGGFDAGRFSDDEAAMIEAGVAAAQSRVRGGNVDAKPDNGWGYPPANLGDWGEDYLTRAMVALGGLAALPLVEAMYCGAWTPDGKRLFSDDRRYRLHFDADHLPPAHAFWSLTLYERMPSGQSFLADNPLNRYAIGDRTPGLEYNADGSLDIWVGRDDPGGARTSNWLPAPPSGSYRMSLRCYLPKPELTNRQYKLPPFEPA